MIWPLKGKKTKGIFSDDEPLTNGDKVHSEKKNIINLNKKDTRMYKLCKQKLTLNA